MSSFISNFYTRLVELEEASKTGNPKNNDQTVSNTTINYDYKLHFADLSMTSCHRVDFKLNIMTFHDFLSTLKFFKNCLFNFNLIDNQNNSYGSGANRSVYLKMANDMIGNILVQNGKYFVDVNTNHIFWDNIVNIESFGRFIYLLLASKTILPFHLPPKYLEILSGNPMTKEEIEYFYEKMYPGIVIDEKYKNNPQEFTKLDVGYNNYEEMIRSEVFNENDKTLAIYYSLAEYQKHLFDYPVNVATMDYVLSGHYLITGEMVKKIFKIRHTLSSVYETIWNSFIDTLTSDEIKQMLVTFSNNLSMNQIIYIIIKDDIQIDIKIYTCMGEVYINKQLFKNSATLSNLKIYFKGQDILNENLYTLRLSTLGESSVTGAVPVSFFPGYYRPFTNFAMENYNEEDSDDDYDYDNSTNLKSLKSPLDNVNNVIDDSVRTHLAFALDNFKSRAVENEAVKYGIKMENKLKLQKSIDDKRLKQFFGQPITKNDKKNIFKENQIHQKKYIPKQPKIKQNRFRSF